MKNFFVFCALILLTGCNDPATQLNDMVKNIVETDKVEEVGKNFFTALFSKDKELYKQVMGKHYNEVDTRYLMDFTSQGLHVDCFNTKIHNQFAVTDCVISLDNDPSNFLISLRIPNLQHVLLEKEDGQWYVKTSNGEDIFIKR